MGTFLAMEPFGKYLLGDRIAYGGMAEIFHAKALGAEGFEKDLVIKRILPAWSQDPEFVEMFVNEATVAARLHHANIVQVFDFNQVEGVFYIAMELVDGKDLHRVLRESSRKLGGFPIRLAVYVTIETLKALHYAHHKSGSRDGVIHRDISPQNILISHGGEVKVTDFGIAKAFSAASLTRPGIVKGKLAYMAPEQLLRTGVDVRTDLYALGIVLWEMLVGRQLFRGESDAETLAAVLQGEIPSPRKFNSEVSSDLADVCLQFLAREQDERHENAAIALRALASVSSIDANAQLDLGELMRELFGSGSTRIGFPPEDGPGGAGAQGGSGARRTGTGDEDPTPLAHFSPEDERRLGGKGKGKAGGRVGVGLGLGTAPGTVALDPDKDLQSLRTLPPRSLAGLSQDALNRTGLRRGVSIGAASVVALGGLVLAYQIIPKNRDGRVLATDNATVDGGIRGDAGARLDAILNDGGASPPVDRPKLVDARAAIDAGPRPKDAAGIPLAHSGSGLIASTGTPVGQTPASDASSQKGMLTVLVRPWAQVYVDGRRVGQTPVRRHRLSPGKHVVVLKNDVLSEQKSETITVDPGEHVVLQRRFSAGP